MVSYMEAAILAIIQGVTEWLPVSSSAHLALAQALLGTSPPLIFDIALHFGTLLSAAAYFRKDILAIARSVLSFDRASREFRLASLIMLASIPTAIIGFALKDFFASFFSSPALVGVALLITGAFLFLTRHAREPAAPLANAPGTNGADGIGTKSAFIIGIAQGIAVAPGISRSGATIGAGMLLGLKKEEAARFSFLLSIPAIIGATAFEAKGAGLAFADPGPTLLGVAIAAVAGYASIGFLLGIIRKGEFSVFAYYCWLLGAATIALAVIGII